MKNKWLLVCLFVTLGQSIFAQVSDLQVQGISPNLYLVHTVQAKENWYSVGRIYNISPKELAPYNTLSLDKALAIGQTLKIPLIAENFSQDGSKDADEVFVPVRHLLQGQEWLYRASVNYNKVPMETLEKWNGVSKDHAKPGMNLIVGYLKVKAALSVLAAHGESKIARTNPVPVNTVEEKTSEVKDQKKPSAPSPVPENVDPTTIRGNTNTAKQETKPVVTNPVATTTTVNTNNAVLTSNSGTESKGSYFKAQYEEAGKSLNGNAGVFKSTSGWSDGKYYALVNNVAVGTIVRINNPVSGKAVFAKVLGNLPDMKESLGLIARISDAAAAELNASGGKFSVEVKY